MDLFTVNKKDMVLHLPLAEKHRPKNFTEFFGQDQLVNGASSILTLIKKTKMAPNLILWGPPGTGKTTFAKLVSNCISGEFLQVSAIDTGAKQLRQLGQSARDRKLTGTSTVLFIDEIHRLNRSQQDVLLPFTESGDFSLIGATTENPSYELNKALLSRARVVLFKKLKKTDLNKILWRVLEREGCELDSLLSSSSQELLFDSCGGDARKLISLVEPIVGLFKDEVAKKGFSFPLDRESLNKMMDSILSVYDKNRDSHYDHISAFIKSIRGSDADAGLYYLAKMICSGEDPVFIARRLVILASEDVGNADPRALLMAMAGLSAVEAVGLPEAGINLAQVVTYLASAPKSNRSYLGYKRAMELVTQYPNLDVPLALKSSQTRLGREFGFGEGYKYSHDGPKGFVDQTFLPDEICDRKLYEPIDRGFEKNIIEYQKWLKK